MEKAIIRAWVALMVILSWLTVVEAYLWLR